MTDTLADAPAAPAAEREPGEEALATRLYIVDGSGYIFRAYHALPPLTRKSDGLPTGAVAGFCNMLWKLMTDMKAAPDAPTHLAVVFDKSEHTFRNELYPEYKAHRPPAPEDLIPQFPLVRDATRAFGVPCLEIGGYEADDIIAAYACQVRDSGGEVVIVSSDKDLMQLVGGPVSMFDPMKNVRIGPAEVFEKFGVTPDKVVDVQALCGDSVDNVPGAPGIGIKTASALINEYGDLDTLLARAGEIKQDKRRQTLIDFADQIRLSRQLVTLDCDTPLPEPVDDLVIAEPDWKTLADFFDVMEFRALARRVAEARGELPPDTQPRAPAAPTELPPVDTTAYECVRHLATLESWIARARAAGVVAIDVPTDGPIVVDFDALRGRACRRPARGLLHPARPRRGRGAGPRDLGVHRADPARPGDHGAQAPARRPVGAQGRAQHQDRHRRPSPARHRAFADRGHAADLVCAGRRRECPWPRRPCPHLARARADRLEERHRLRQGANQLRQRAARARDHPRRRAGGARAEAQAPAPAAALPRRCADGL